MTRPQRPDTTDAWKADQEARLRALEVGGRAEHTTMQGGLFRIRNVAGDLKMSFGDLDSDETTWGLRLEDGGVIEIAAGGQVMLHNGGQIAVFDNDDNRRAAMGDLDDVGDAGPWGFGVYRGGVFKMIDEAGTARARLGDLTEDVAGDDNFGVEIFDKDGGRRFCADGDGLKDPWVQIAFHDVAFEEMSLIDLADPTDWNPMLRAHVLLVSHKGVRTKLGLLVDGITMETRLAVTDDEGTRYTDVFELSGSQLDYQEIAWLHGVPLGSDATFTIEVRVTAGTYDSVDDGALIRPPMELNLTDPEGCTEGGFPA